jgi:1-acyl-sn-glycerol-3-phosphate acyltransferase
MRESLRPTSERYQIRWEGRLGFARLAVKAQVPVLLAACPAADDIYEVYDNPITPEVYRRFKWPLPLARGLGPTPLPRPVKLTHVIGRPMPPPQRSSEEIDEADVRAYHARLVQEMNRLMREALKRA